MPRLRPVAPTLALATFLLAACSPAEGSGSEDLEDGSSAASGDPPHVVASDPVAAGRYLVQIGGCNDCHTEGYLQNEGDVPSSDWLAGNPLGFRGPWGTSYPRNLRLMVRSMSEDDWVARLHRRKTRPPMPWFNLHAMSEQDLRAIYRFIATLEPAGEPVPEAVPPSREPSTPYIPFAPREPGSEKANR